ncbi:unnamed protein product [Ilex paraguariensis]|uniref:Uncharacterized protein n=1 Tax=Ilex paraguariensis TaxID=185542 RepID=A0ABC8QZI7_9AQUA
MPQNEMVQASSEVATEGVGVSQMPSSAPAAETWGNPVIPPIDVAPAQVLTNSTLAPCTLPVSQVMAPTILTHLVPPSRNVDYCSASIDELFGDVDWRHRR